MKINKFIFQYILGYILLNALNKQDYEKLQSLFNDKFVNVDRNISKVIDIYNDYFLDNDNYDFKSDEINKKIDSIKKEIKNINADSIADKIYSKYKK